MVFLAGFLGWFQVHFASLQAVNSVPLTPRRSNHFLIQVGPVRAGSQASSSSGPVPTKKQACVFFRKLAAEKSVGSYHH
jgi:hypothetical protein